MKKIKFNLFTTATGTAIALLLLVSSSCKKDNATPDKVPTPKDTTLKVSSLSNTTLHYGDTLTIKGNNFSTTAFNNTVSINGVSAMVLSATATEVKVIVPAVGATGGEVKISTGSQGASGGNISYIPDVFVAGYQNTGAFELATYWKNGNPVTLSTNQSALSSMFINGNDVFAAGYERINNLKLANYWKNGIKTTVGINESAANAISSNGNDVYLGGWEVINGFDLPRFWKNGVGTTIYFTDAVLSTVITGNGSCTGVYASGSNVYAVGSARTSQGTFMPWECTNGVIPADIVPNNYKHSFANAVFINGNDKFVAGCQNNTTTGLAMATVWKNGISTTLTTGDTSVAVGTSVYAAGNDVYVAGYDQEDYYHGGATFAKYWKNGVPVKLSTAPSTATGIMVFGNDVYVSGWEDNGPIRIAKYWKNGVPVTLGKDNLSSGGNAIVVR
ncbi:MAG: IPT/TIG domain-containing protein [Chitinophagaceae bacterium]|nr:IPT/TIG domain-containing protein [Chitinophagaceae bacterium]